MRYKIVILSVLILCTDTIYSFDLDRQKQKEEYQMYLQRLSASLTGCSEKALLIEGLIEKVDAGYSFWKVSCQGAAYRCIEHHRRPLAFCTEEKIVRKKHLR